MEVVRPISTLVQEMRYDATAKALEVVFVSRGGTPTEFYRYTNITEEIWNELKNPATSVGRSFQIIRGNKTAFPFTKHLINEPVTSDATDTLEQDLKKSVKTNPRQPRFSFKKE